MLLNNTLNIFLILPNIILYFFLFIKHLWIFEILLVLIGLKPIEKNVYTSF